MFSPDISSKNIGVVILHSNLNPHASIENYPEDVFPQNFVVSFLRMDLHFDLLMFCLPVSHCRHLHGTFVYFVLPLSTTFKPIHLYLILHYNSMTWYTVV